MVKLCGCAGWSAPFDICKQQSQGFLFEAHMMSKPRVLAVTPGWPCQKQPDLIMQRFQRRTIKECLLTVPMRCFFCGFFLLFVFRDCLSYCLVSRVVPWSLVVTYWERLTSWLSFMWCILFFVTFPYGVIRQVWYLIVLIPNICLLRLFNWEKPSLYRYPFVWHN